MSSAHLNYTADETGITLQMEEKQSGISLFKPKSQLVDAQRWIEKAGPSVLSAMARIQAAIEDGEEGASISEDETQLKMSHDFAAQLSDAQAASLGLPPPLPYIIRLDSTGPLIADNANVALKYLRSGGRQSYPTRQGCFLHEGSSIFRLSGHIYEVVLAVEQINQQTNLDDRLDGLSRLREQLAQLDGVQYSADQQIEGMKIAHASALSLELRAGNELSFDPILYKQEGEDRSADAQISEDDHLLTPRQQQAFATAFRKRDGTKASYLADDVFVYIDPALRVATKVVRNMQDAPQEERRRFLRSPQSFVREALLEAGEDEEFVDELIDATFLITEELSARVRDLGIWHPPVIPFRESGGTDWKTIEFGVRVGDKKVVLSPDELDQVGRKIAQAISDNVDVVEIDAERSLPADTNTLEAINALRIGLAGLPAIEIPEPSGEPDDGAIQPKEKNGEDSGPSVLIVETNFDNETFTIETSPRWEFSSFQAPAGLIKQPKDHQVTGIAWLQECWSKGYPGVLLADDMGLGKTFQTLAFLSWLKETRSKVKLAKRPTLIVAPTSLLGTWQAEAHLHLESDSLGDFALLYGSDLKSLKTARRNDVTEGRATLHLESLRSADWILTTYETMRDYHISLAQMQFSCAVFDEMQKLKNESSLMTNASRALNIDFKIGLTGTPVENTLQELWTIMDTLMPGVLGFGSMKQFTEYYIQVEDDEDTKRQRMFELNARVTQRLNENPPPMLRRMKSDVAKDLPKKIEQTLDREMGTRQANSYHEALTMLREGHSRTQKLEAFHRMRSVSLHPAAFDGSGSDSTDMFIAESARLSQTLEILDKIEKAGEKALLFVESIEMHNWLSTYLQHRYGMSHKPDRIYGQVSALARQKIVDRFQSPRNSGFDVLLLSPKAAGVGLTLTAANHVIHLTRWWNPAVEDQCTDRAYRIGQTQDVKVYYPRALHPVYGERSFDGILHGLLERKRGLSRDVLAPANADETMDMMVNELQV